MGFGVQAVLTVLIVTASINLGFWFFALPFRYYATLQVVRQFNELDEERERSEGESEESEGAVISKI